MARFQNARGTHAPAKHGRCRSGHDKDESQTSDSRSKQRLCRDISSLLSLMDYEVAVRHLLAC